MGAQPSHQETARAEARKRFREEWRGREKPRKEASRSRPRGNQSPDHGDIERGVERIWAVVGR
jgi:hypothetical protein